MRHSKLSSVAVPAVVMLLAAACSPSSGSTTHESIPVIDDRPSPDGVRPAVVIEGVGRGWSHDEEGALAAAANAVSVTGEIARAGFITREDLIESIASDGFASELAEMSSQQLDELSVELGEAGIVPSELVWSEIPLRARIVTTEPDEVTVDVWSVLVVGVPGHGAPRQAWRTVTVHLIWEREDWRIDGWDVAAGPTPALAAAAKVSTVDDVSTVVDWSATGAR
jgi:hypothetical protein